jgi:hypothetical protein
MKKSFFIVDVVRAARSTEVVKKMRCGRRPLDLFSLPLSIGDARRIVVLFDCDGFREIARLIDVASAADSDVISHQL